MRTLFIKKIGARRVLLLASALGLVLPRISSAQPLAQTGVRVDAMGGAFLAVANDANALQFNPAGLLNQKEKYFFEGSHHAMFLGLDGLGMTQAGLAYNHSTRRAGRQVLGPRFVEESAAVLASPSPAFAEDTLLQRYSLGLQAQIQNFPGYNQNAVRATFAYGFKPLMKDEHLSKYDETARQAPFRYTVGLGLRYLWASLNRDFLEDANHVNDIGEQDVIKAFLANESPASNDWALDASATYFFNDKLQAAFSVMNLRSPNLAAKLAEVGKSSDGAFARRYRLGAAYRVFERWLVAVDVEKNPDGRGWVEDYNLYAGAEYDALERLVLRGGLNRNWVALGASLILPGNLRLHGAWQHDLHNVNFNNLRFGFGFGR